MSILTIPVVFAFIKGLKMNFYTFLIEFYPYPDCVHAEYDEISAENLEDAVGELKKYHPDAEI